MKPRLLTSSEMNAVSGGVKPPFVNWPNSGHKLWNEDTKFGVVFDNEGYWIGNGTDSPVFKPYTPA
jgi:hypothetical protein